MSKLRKVKDWLSISWLISVAIYQLKLSRSQNGLHATHIHLIFEHNNEDVILDLHLNDNFIPVEHFISYQEPNGDKAIKNFTKTEIDLCHYQVSATRLLLSHLISRFSLSIDLGQNTKQPAINCRALHMRWNPRRRVWWSRYLLHRSRIKWTRS